MLSLRTLPYRHLPLSSLKSLFSLPPLPLSLRFPHPIPYPVLSSSSSFATAATAAEACPMDPTTTDPTFTVEHVVLFKVREGTDPAKIDAMVSNLRSLTSLDLATYLTAGPILRLRSAPASAAGFTHLLHSRYRSQPDLAAYSAHPTHLSVVRENLPICEDIMAVDWLGDGQLPVPSPGSALRLTLAKPKEGTATADVLAAIDEIKKSVVAGKAEQLSSGENFSPARAKGYTVGFISVFKSVEELDALMEDKDVLEAQKEKLRPLLESVIVLDYVIPQATSASL